MRGELFFVRFLLTLALSLIAGLYVLMVPGDAFWLLIKDGWAVASVANLVGYVVSEIREARRR